MKHTAQVLVGAVFATMLLISSCLGQSDTSVADAARAARKDKASPAPTKVFDNDTLPTEEHISVVGQSGVTSSTSQANGAQATQKSEAGDVNKEPEAKNEDKTKLTIEPGQTAGDREEVYGEWRKKVADQKDTITLLQRELDVLQREYRLRAAAMYADVGNRLRNQADWDKQDRDYKDTIDAKQKDLDRAKQQLSDLQEDARKSGVPMGVVQ
jgi:hypothetical protein